MPDANTYRTLENFTLTPRAESSMRQLLQSTGGAGEAGLRLTVRSQGWAGLSGALAAEPSAQVGDHIVSLPGVRLFLTRESLSLLDGVLIDCDESCGRTRLSFLDLRSLTNVQISAPLRSSCETQP